MSAAERDELAAIYVGTLNRGHGVIDRPEQGVRAADAILAAGYRKRRAITTVEELNALPEGAEIVDCYERLTLRVDAIGFLEWHDNHGNVCNVELPATVLFDPEATQ